MYLVLEVSNRRINSLISCLEFFNNLNYTHLKKILEISLGAMTYIGKDFANYLSKKIIYGGGGPDV